MSPREDPTVREVRKWVKIVTMITAGVVAALTPLVVFYVTYWPDIRNARSGADEAKNDVKAGYQALSPAVVELQNIANQGKRWQETSVTQHTKLAGNQLELEKRLIRCEVYMDILGKRRNLPRPPTTDSPMVSRVETKTRPDPPGRKPMVQQTARYKVPDDFARAKAKAKKRAEEKCKPGDPLCGELE
jgi:peroxiredoxin family protein